MNNLFIIGLIFLFSIILGLIKYGSLANHYRNSMWQLKFIEIWNDIFNYFLAGLIGYYFILIRWPLLQKYSALTLSDFILFIIFAFGIFGHLCVISKNITEGVEAILKKVLDRK